MKDRIKQKNNKTLNRIWNNTKEVFGETKRAVNYHGSRVHSYTGRVATDVQDLFAVKTSPDSIARDVQRSFQPPRDNGRYVDLTKPKRKGPSEPQRKRRRVDWNNLGVDI